MTTAERNKRLENLIEQKILEFLGDPDSGLELKKSFALKLRKRMKEKQKLTPLSVVARRYGLN